MRGRIAKTALPLYIGGFLGPFGGGVLSVLIPQLRDAFAAPTGAIAAAIPAYLVPFALLQLVSGTIGERLGRRRVVRAGYIVYAITSLGAAASPTLATFLAARAAQGAANAFVTPLLLAALADAVKPGALGRSVGTFAAVQTAAVALSPLCGGVLGAVDWRLVFALPACVAALLALLPPPDEQQLGERRPARLRDAATPRVGLLSAAAFASYAGVTGLAFLVALRCADAFSLGSSARGVVVAGFGLAGMMSGRAAGALVDRVGRVPIVLAGASVCGILVAMLGLARSPATIAALWFVAGIGSAVIWAGLNTLTVEAVPRNRAGATSIVSGIKFMGNALAPVAWLPLYHADPRLGFIAAGITALSTGLFTLPLARRGPPAAEPSAPVFPRGPEAQETLR